MEIKPCRREIVGILRKVRQLCVINNGAYFLGIVFRNNVSEVVFQSVFVSWRVRNSFSDVESQGCEAVFVEVDFLVVWNLANIAVGGSRLS